MLVTRPPITTRIADAIDLAVEIAAAAMMTATVVIALVQVFCRYVLNDSLIWPEEMARFAFVWFVFLGAAMVTRRSGHIVIDLLPRALGPRALRVHATAVRVISAAVAVLSDASRIVAYQRDGGDKSSLRSTLLTLIARHCLDERIRPARSVRLHSGGR